MQLLYLTPGLNPDQDRAMQQLRKGSPLSMKGCQVSGNATSCPHLGMRLILDGALRSVKGHALVAKLQTHVGGEPRSLQKGVTFLLLVTLDLSTQRLSVCRPDLVKLWTKSFPRYPADNQQTDFPFRTPFCANFCLCPFPSSPNASGLLLCYEKEASVLPGTHNAGHP